MSSEKFAKNSILLKKIGQASNKTSGAVRETPQAHDVGKFGGAGRTVRQDDSEM